MNSEIRTVLAVADAMVMARKTTLIIEWMRTRIAEWRGEQVAD